ncbi:MAG: proline racemase family protein [Planctomycetes bacterium]|nr:proline racemase family protein [Planctomycetota bacterium]MCB9887959.1 proline racemase family protein [Planctomycetota bacterium]
MIDYAHTIQAIDSHTAGEPTRIVTGGLPDVPGATMVDKRAWLRQNVDRLRTGLVLEPRGHDAIVLAYLLPATRDDADCGVVFANEVGYLNMCGHGAIGVATVLVATGRVAATEPETRVVLDTPAGPVTARVVVRSGRPVAVKIRNVPSFLHKADFAVEVPGRGRITVDIAYGGNWFAIIREDQAGLTVEPQHRNELLQFADRVRTALLDAGEQGFHPTTAEPQVIDHIEIYAPRQVPEGVGARTLTLCPGMSYDRSPCGTGTSAKLAVMHARGQLAVGEQFHNQSICGTEFIGTVLEQVDVAGRQAVIPQVQGSAFITGFQQFVFDPLDPLAFGM